jgi:RNA polymerase sigma-70 factor, ECF subfamily
MRDRGAKRVISKPMDKPRAPGTSAASRNITRLLRAWSEGDETALELLVPLIEDDLRRLARTYMARERAGHTLQATALVNEVFLRLPAARGLRWQDRAHFIGIAARLMRRVLVDHARVRGFQKRGGDAQRVTLDPEALATSAPSVDVLAVDRALEAFAKVDARKSQVVELRFFGGLSLEEIADVLQVSVDTVKRDWRLARLWLARALQADAQQRTPGRPPR